MRVRRLSWMGGVIFTLALATSSIRAAEFEKYLPDDTEVVFHANIRQALDSALGKKYLSPIQSIKGQENVPEMLSALGLDPVKDIHSFTLAVSGKINEKDWTAILTGNFNQDKIQSAAETFASKQADALKVSKQDGATIYELRDKSSRSAFATFIERNTLLASGTKNVVTGAIANKGVAKTSNLNKEIVALIKERSGKESLWMAMVPNQILDALGNNKQAIDIAKKVKSLKCGVTLTDGIQLSMRILATDDKAARAVRQTLEGVKALLTLAVSSNDQLKDFGPTLTDILNSVKFTLDKSTVGMDLSVSGKQIEEGLNK